MEKEEDPGSFINRASPYTHLVLPLIVVLSFVLIFWHLKFYLFSGIDSVWYSYAATLYSQGEWLSQKATIKGPGFTLLLSFFFRIFGPTFWASRSVSVLFGGLLPIIVYLLGSQLFDKKVGLLSAFLCAINPLLILYSCLTFREILFSFTWMCCIYLGIRGLSGSRLHAALSGIAFALSSMIIESGLFIGLGFIVYYFLVRKILRNTEEECKCDNMDIFFFAGVLALFPLVIRNYSIYGYWFFCEFSFCDLFFVSFMALYILFALIIRLLDKRTSPMSIDRTTTIALSIGVIVTFAVVVTTVEPLRGLAVNSIVGFIKLAEYMILPESLGLLAFFCVFGATQAMRLSRRPILPLCIFFFSIAPLAMWLPFHYHTYANVNLEELIFRHEIWPIENAYRYVASFIPLLTIFASYGVFTAANKLGYIVKIRRRTFKTIVIFVVILFVLLQFLYSDTDIRLRAGADFKALEKNYHVVIDWLNDRGSPPVYSFNPILKELYGEDKVFLLSNESFSDILERASIEKIRFVISDTFGSYSDAQFALFWGGWVGHPEYWVPKDFKLVYSSTNWPLVQIYQISLPP